MFCAYNCCSRLINEIEKKKITWDTWYLILNADECLFVGYEMRWVLNVKTKKGSVRRRCRVRSPRIWSNTRRQRSTQSAQRQFLRRLPISCAIWFRLLPIPFHLGWQCLQKRRGNGIWAVAFTNSDGELTFDGANGRSRCEITFRIEFTNSFQQNRHRSARIKQKQLRLCVIHSQAFGAEPPELFTFKNACQAFVTHSANFKWNECVKMGKLGIEWARIHTLVWMVDFSAPHCHNPEWSARSWRRHSYFWSLHKRLVPNQIAHRPESLPFCNSNPIWRISIPEKETERQTQRFD